MTAPKRRPGRSERTRAALVAAGRRLFCERPVDAVSIDDIVQTAEVAKGSFYNHFPDREALVRAITSEIRAGVEAAVDQANAGIDDPALRVARAVCVYLRYALDEPERAGVLVRVQSGHTSLRAPLNRGLVDDITQGLGSRRFNVPDVEAGVIFVLGVSQAALTRVTESRDPRAAAGLARSMGALLLRGLGLEGGEADLIATRAAQDIVAAAAPTIQSGPAS